MADIKIEGVERLSRKLDQLGGKLGANALKAAVRKSTQPVVREMRARIPVGSRIHKTYKGLIVGPGFARRSISRRTKKSRVGLSHVIGIRAQAFYAINFLDLGPHAIISRGKRSIKPYTLRRRPWFLSVFVRNQGKITRDLSKQMKLQIDKATRSG